jgi:hypothetical protein
LWNPAPIAGGHDTAIGAAPFDAPDAVALRAELGAELEHRYERVLEPLRARGRRGTRGGACPPGSVPRDDGAAKHVRGAPNTTTRSRREHMTRRHPLPDTPVQVVAIAATGGTFALTYSGQTTRPLAFDAAPAELQSALEALSRIGTGNVAVSGPAGGPFELRFGGELIGRNVEVVEPEDEDLEGSVQVTTQVPSPWE